MNPAPKIFLLLFFCFIFGGVGSYCQVNLVPNYSFEIYDTCPNNQDQLSYAIGWGNYNYGSADYFNSCNPCNNSGPTCFSVPYNWAGFQFAASGNAYAGLYTMEDTFPSINNREYIGMQLSSTMNIGTKYYASFKVNLALTSSADFNTATDRLGILFSTIPYSSSNPAPINNFAHIYTTNIITDTTNWTTISGSFIADSSYDYISIGNFFNDSNTNFTRLLFDSNILGAYYLIDDVCVSTDSMTCANLNSINDDFFQNNIIIYPNPVIDASIIKIPGILQDGNTIELMLLNLLGQKVIDKKIIIENEKIIFRRDNSILSGLYYLTIKIQQHIYIQKIIIN